MLLILRSSSDQRSKPGPGPIRQEGGENLRDGRLRLPAFSSIDWLADPRQPRHNERKHRGQKATHPHSRRKGAPGHSTRAEQTGHVSSTRVRGRLCFYSGG